MAKTRKQLTVKSTNKPASGRITKSKAHNIMETPTQPKHRATRSSLKRRQSTPLHEGTKVGKTVNTLRLTSTPAPNKLYNDNNDLTTTNAIVLSKSMSKCPLSPILGETQKKGDLALDKSIVLKDTIQETDTGLDKSLIKRKSDRKQTESLTKRKSDNKQMELSNLKSPPEGKLTNKVLTKDVSEIKEKSNNNPNGNATKLGQGCRPTRAAKLNHKLVSVGSTKEITDNNVKKKSAPKTTNAPKKDPVNPSTSTSNISQGGQSCRPTRVAKTNHKCVSTQQREVSDKTSASNSVKKNNSRSQQRREKSSLIDSTLQSGLTNTAEPSLLKQINADWSIDTSLKTPTTLNAIKKNPIIGLRRGRRKLAPLIEVISEESVSTPTTSKENGPKNKSHAENECSSSEEFENSDDIKLNQSKRAPKWKDLQRISKPPVQSTNKKLIVRKRATRKSGSAARKHESLSSRTLRPVPDLKETNKRIDLPQEKLNSEESKLVEDKSEKSVEQSKSTTETTSITSRGNYLDVTKETISPHRKINLVKQADLIDEILSSPDEHDENAENDVNITNVKNGLVLNDFTNLSNLHDSKKFFTTRSKTADTLSENNVQSNTPIKKKLGKRNTQEVIYDFSSQSYSDASDPAADIIKKLIDTGKVCVAKHKKGSGRLVISKKKRVISKNPVTTLKTKVVKKPPSRIPLNSEPNNDSDSDDQNFDDIFHDDDHGDHGSFSALARSAMVKEAEKTKNPLQRQMITDKKQLLTMAKQIVRQSTPVRQQIQPRILSPHPTMAGSASPWRVDDETLPKTFYFSRNSSNLPSFSSDHIPSSPTKRKIQSSSSFSSNDSNMENIAPANTQPSASNTSNIQRNAGHRSPLKSINIIDCIVLPPKKLNPIPEDSVSKDSKIDFSEVSCIEKISDIKSLDKDNLFGFEDLLEDVDEEDTVQTENYTTNEKQLKEDLRKLRHLRPEQYHDKPSTSNYKQAKLGLFKQHKPQQTVREMLCSTMIEKKPETDTAANNDVDIGLENLFADPEPAASFCGNNTLRTYAKPKERKRKKYEILTFMNSDESDDDRESVATQKKCVKKRPEKRNLKEQEELNKFIKEFNEMCDDVSKYELIVA